MWLYWQFKDTKGKSEVPEQLTRIEQPSRYHGGGCYCPQTGIGAVHKGCVSAVECRKLKVSISMSDTNEEKTPISIFFPEHTLFLSLNEFNLSDI